MSVKTSLLWSVLEQGGSKVVSLVTQIVLARLLTPEDFGVLAILLVVFNVCDAIAQSGFGSALIQKEVVTSVSYSTAFWLSMVIAMILYISIFFAAPMIGDFYGNESMAVYLRVLGLCLFVSAANSIQRSNLQREMDFKALFRTSIIAVTGSGIFGIVLATAGFGIWALLAQFAANNVLACLVMTLAVEWRPRAEFSRGEVREIFGFGWKMGATAILNATTAGVSDLVLGKVVSTFSLGVYSQGKKYPVAVIGALSNALANVFFPALSRLKGDSGTMRAFAEKGLVLGTSVVAPATVLLAIVAEPLVGLLLSEKWLPCVPIFQMVSVSYCLLLLQVVNLRAYMALGRSDVYLAVHIVRAGMSVAVTVVAALLTQDIYLVAAAWATASAVCILLVDIAPAGRVYGLPAIRQIQVIAPIYIACGVAAVPAAMVLSIGLAYLPELILQSAVFVAVYVLTSKIMHCEAIFEAMRVVRGN